MVPVFTATLKNSSIAVKFKGNIMKFLVALGLVCISLMSVGQRVDIEWGESIDSKTEILRIIGEDEDKNVYALGYKSKTYYLEKYKGDALAPSFSKELIFPEISGTKQRLLNIYLMEDVIIALSEVYLKKADKYEVNAYTISLSGIMDKEPKRILSIDAKTRSKSGVTESKISEDRKLIMVSNVSFDSKDQNDINIQIFDSQFKLVNSQEEKVTIKRPGEKAYVTIANFVLNNTGSMYYTKEVMFYKGAFSFSSSILNDRDYFVVRLSENGGKKEIPVELKNLKVAQMGLKIDENNNVKLGGFYYKKQSRGLFKGIYLRGSFFVLIDGKTQEKIAESSAEFDDDMMLEYRSEKQLDKGVYLDNRFYVKELVNKDDGGTLIIAEYFTVVYGQSNGLLQPVTYTYGDMVVVDVDKKGNIQWSKTIFKNQIYQQTRLNLGMATGGLAVMFSIPVSNDETVYFSYLVDIVDGNIIFIFNDHGANTDLSVKRRKIKPMTNPKKGIPMMVSIDKYGKVKKELLANSLKGDVIMRPRVSYKNTETDEIVIYGSKKGDDKLGRLTIR